MSGPRAASTDMFRNGCAMSPAGLTIVALMILGCLAGCAREEKRTTVSVDVSGRYDRARATRPNPDLWAAANQHVEFVRKTMSDPFGGLLATDWYTPKSTPGERFRLTISILGPALIETNLKIVIFKQVRRGGVWRSEAVSASTVAALHARIMQAARVRAGDSKS